MREWPDSPAPERNDFQEENPVVPEIKEESTVPVSTEQELIQEQTTEVEQSASVEQPESPVYVEEPETRTGGGGGEPPAGSGGGSDGGDEDEDEGEMAKMSFLEHLDELRKRIIYALISVGTAFIVCFTFSKQMFDFVSVPLRQALLESGLSDNLFFNKPTEGFTTFLNLALMASLFLASPFVLYQVWAFISPGLYKRERRYATPFIFFCSGLFIAGGAFGYFIAFRYALKFLVTYPGGRAVPIITMSEYMDLFWTVILGLGIIFELPVLMLFLGLLGIINPGFLVRNFRYAVLIIFAVAAVITPTSDIINLMIFAVPMMLLYVVGIGLVWLVARRRREQEA